MLAPWKNKCIKSRDSLLKSRAITLPTKVPLVKAMVLPVVMYAVRTGPWRSLRAEELILFNCGGGGDSSESLGLAGDQTSQSQRKSTLDIHWKDWCWSWSSNTLTIWCKKPTLCDPMDRNTPGFPVLHYLLEFAQTHVHWASDSIQPSHPLLSPSPTFSLSQIRVFSNESVLRTRWPKY